MLCSGVVLIFDDAAGAEPDKDAAPLHVKEHIKKVDL